jgi:hypothetical protein
VLIPANTFVVGDVIDIHAQWLNNSGTTYQRYGNIYVNTTNAIPSSTLQIFGGINSSSAFFYSKIQNRFEIAGSTSTRQFNAAGGAGTMTTGTINTGLGQTSAMYTNNINWAVNQYIIFTCRNVNGTGGDGMALAGYQIYKG